MEIIIRAPFSFERILFWVQASVLAGIVLMVLVLGVRKPSEMALSLRPARGDEGLDLSKILSGPLALKENTKSPLVVSLENQLVLLAQSARPDLKKMDRFFCIGVKGTDAQKIVKEGEAIYVDLKQFPTGAVETIQFVDEGKAMMIPHLLDSHSILLQLKGLDEPVEVVLEVGIDQSIGMGIDSAVKALEHAKMWGSDLLFKIYGGQEYGVYGNKQQLEISEGAGSYVVYVGEGDFLMFREGRWQTIASLDAADRNLPLAQVQKLSWDRIEIEAWDAEGFTLFYAKMSREKASPLQMNLSEVIRDPKLRNEHTISCRLGKQHCLIRRGDWLIQKKNLWQKLRKPNELEAFLNHDLRGTLFVVEDIDQNGSISGKFFDEMRTQSVSGQLRATSSKAGRKKTKCG